MSIVFKNIDEIDDIVHKICENYDGDESQDIGSFILSIAMDHTLKKLENDFEKKNTYDEKEIFDIFYKKYQNICTEVHNFLCKISKETC